MALSALDEKDKPPTAARVAAVLGRARALWDDLLAHCGATHAPLSEKWNFPNVNYGWSLQLKRKDRTVLYMTPQRGYLIVSLVLGEKAVRAARESGLPDAVLGVVDAAPRYAEGRGVRFEVRNKILLKHVEKLAAIKMAT